MLNETEVLKLLLPEFLIDHFDIVKCAEENKVVHIYFEEKTKERVYQLFIIIKMQSSA